MFHPFHYGLTQLNHDQLYDRSHDSILYFGYLLTLFHTCIQQILMIKFKTQI